MADQAGLEERLAILEAKDAIRELTAAYCFAVAEGRGDDIVAMFTDDGVFKMRGHEWAGRARLEEMYGSVDAGGATPKPFIQNHVISVDGDVATGRCGVEIRMVHKGDSYTVAGHYYDSYRRVDGQWRFAERDFHVFHWVPLSKGWA